MAEGVSKTLDNLFFDDSDSEEESSSEDVENGQLCSEEDLDTCIRVLRALQANPDEFWGPSYHTVRSLASSIFTQQISRRTGATVLHGDIIDSTVKAQFRSRMRKEDLMKRRKTGLRREKREMQTKGNSQLHPRILPSKDYDEVIIEDAKNSEEDEEDDIYMTMGTKCYVCLQKFFKLHHFYDKLCPSCASSNFSKRTQSTNLKGRIALITGARIKIGFFTALKLLRAGATVIATTRFVHDAAKRYSEEEDFKVWKDRLHIFGIDFRFLSAVESFCDMLDSTFPHLDILINNAAQTIRRPPQYYKRLLPFESTPYKELPPNLQPLVKAQHGYNFYSNTQKSNTLLTGAFQKQLESFDSCTALVKDNSKPTNVTPMLTQIPLTKDDMEAKDSEFPLGKLDEYGEQLDVRTTNTWTKQLEDVDTCELLEDMVINSCAPYVIIKKTKKMMERSPFVDRFIINVTSVEGKFSGNKVTLHPHTNMSKASLNMITRTTAAYFAKSNIWMNCADPGWVSELTPVGRAQKLAAQQGTASRPPLDEIDGAARILDPICMALNNGTKYYGAFLKDYHIVQW